MPRTSKRISPPLDADALERVEWASDVVVESFGTRVRIRSTDAPLVDEALRRLPSMSVRRTARRASLVLSAVAEIGQYPDSFGVYAGAERALPPMEREEVWAAVESAANLHVAEHARDRVFIHCGCVAWKGLAILVPGRSFSGKTTLVTAFLRAGATYYSDEYAVLDESGLVHPFPRLLSVRTVEGALPDKVSHETYTSALGSEPVEVACVVHTTFDAARVGKPWRPRRLTPGHVTLALLDNAVPARTRPDSTLRAIKHVAERALGLSGPRGDAEAVVKRVLRALG